MTCADEGDCDNCEELRAQLEALQRAAEPTRKRLERLEAAARAMLREADALVERCSKPHTSCTPGQWFERAADELREVLAATDNETKEPI